MSDKERIEELTSALASSKIKLTELTSQNTELTSQNTELTSQNTELTSQNAELTAEIANLQEQINKMKRMIFGSKREKLPEEIADQLGMFNEAEEGQSVKEREKEKQEFVEGYVRKKKRTREETFRDLPKERVVIPAEETNCPVCGAEMVKIGEDFVRYELSYKPAEMHLREIYVEVYACPKCGKDPEKDALVNDNTKNVIVKAKATAAMMEKSYCSPELLAHILWMKYIQAVPLERQRKEYKALGVELSSATLANWVIEGGQRYLRPIYEELHRRLLIEPLVQADETVVQVLREPGKKAQSQSRMWVYATGTHAKDQIVLYDYRPDRKGKNAAEFLEGFHGHLVCDGYDGYNKLKDVNRCGCWAHVRRKFFDAIPADEKLKKDSYAARAVVMIDAIFHEETEMKGKPPEERLKQRQERSRAHLDGFFAWLDSFMASGGSKLAKAVQYAKNEKKYLYKFLEDPIIPVDNNLAERAVKPFVIGRKNWLFSTSVKGADTSAKIYSILNTALLNGWNAEEYLVKVFRSPGELILPF